jgi:hypothetical protein
VRGRGRWWTGEWALLDLDRHERSALPGLVRTLHVGDIDAELVRTRDDIPRYPDDDEDPFHPARRHLALGFALEYEPLVPGRRQRGDAKARPDGRIAPVEDRELDPA